MYRSMSDKHSNNKKRALLHEISKALKIPLELTIHTDISDESAA